MQIVFAYLAAASQQHWGMVSSLSAVRGARVLQGGTVATKSTAVLTTCRACRDI